MANHSLPNLEDLQLAAVRKMLCLIDAVRDHKL